MDISKLTQRLTSLNLSPSSPPSTDSTPLLTYFFTPKSGTKHPLDDTKDLKLVLVTLEDGKNLGPAKQVAQSVGLKDMRAVSGTDLDKLLSRTREQGKPSITTTLYSLSAS